MKNRVVLILLSMLVVLISESQCKYRSKKSNLIKKDSSSYSKIVNNNNNKRHRKRLDPGAAVAASDQPVSLFDDDWMKEFKNVYKGQFFFRKLVNGQGKDVLQLKSLSLNQYGLYVADGEDTSLNGLSDMIRLDEMVSDEEIQDIKDKKPELENTIGEVSLIKIEQENNLSGIFPCFVIQDEDKPDEDWQICDYSTQTAEGKQDISSKTLESFRVQLINKIIQNVEFKNNVKFAVTVIMNNENGVEFDNFEDWTYDKQDYWGGECKNANQSPIDIITAEILTTTSQIQFQTGYKGDAQAFVVNGPNDKYIVGHLGYSFYQNNLETQQGYYCPFRIEFKFSGEHQIDGAEQQMEVLVYHKQNMENEYNGGTVGADNGCEELISPVVDAFRTVANEQTERDLLTENTQLIVSFLVNPTLTNPEENGMFWQSLSNINFASVDNDHRYGVTPLSLEAADAHGKQTIADLEGLCDDGLQARFLHSFYYYTGSLSQPSCSQDIKRIVMYEQIQISQDVFDNIKEKVLDGYKIKQNFRKPANLDTKTMKGYKVYKHIDQSQKQKCPTKKIMEKFTNPKYKKLLSGKQFVDYEKLIQSATLEQQKYSSTYKLLNQQQKAQEVDEGIQKKNIKFTHDVKINTNVNHIHKIPKALANKIFGNNPSAGDITKLNHLDTELHVTYLAKNANDYSKNIGSYQQAATISDEAKSNMKIANKLIEDHDIYEVENGKPENAINPNYQPVNPVANKATDAQETNVATPVVPVKVVRRKLKLKKL